MLVSKEGSTNMETGMAGSEGMEPVKAEEWVPHEVVRYRPARGETLLRTPASFLWPPVKGAIGYELEYSRSPKFSVSETTTAGGLTLNMHTPAEAMAPGTWYWRVRPVLPEERLGE